MKEIKIIRLIIYAIFIFYNTINAQEYFVNNFDLSSDFDKDEIINKIGVPDTITEGGEQIIQEFGFNTYTYRYGTSYIDFQETSNAITNISISDSSLSINTIKVGDSISSVKDLISDYSDNGERIVKDIGDYASLAFEYDSSGLITKITYVVFT